MTPSRNGNPQLALSRKVVWYRGPFQTVSTWNSTVVGSWCCDPDAGAVRDHPPTHPVINDAPLSPTPQIGLIAGAAATYK